MSNENTALFQPLKIGSMEVKNRIAMAGMGAMNFFSSAKTRAQGAGWNEAAAVYYLERAKGGCGLIFEGAEHIQDLSGQGNWFYELLEDEDNFKNLKRAMDGIHSYGCKFITQLSAGTGRSYLFNVNHLDGVDLVKALKAPSPIPSYWYPGMTCREITKEEIHEIVSAYARCAKTLQAAGVDGIEVHALHEGYLLDSFTCANMNHRTDEYGGSLENRMRFVTDIIRAVKKECGKDFIVSVRFSVNSMMKGYNQGVVPGEVYTEFGRTMPEAIAQARMLEEAGCDMLNTDMGTYDAWYWAHPPVYMPKQCNLPYSAFLKHFVNIPVFCAGKMDEPSLAIETIERQEVDGITIGRALLADPEWPNKVKAGDFDNIRPCISCHNGCFGRCMRGLNMSCALNPVAAQEQKYVLKKAEPGRRVAVIGGGIGGMEAARICKLRGFDVTLYEKSDKLGGVFIPAASMSFKEDDRKLIDWYRKQLTDLNVDVRLNHTVTQEELNGLDANEIIIATGSASPKTLPVKGFDGENVVSAVDFLNGKNNGGKRFAIIGGGLTGCELAYELAKSGREVTIVEIMPDILQEPELSKVNSNMLRDLFRFHNVRVEASAKVVEITPTGLRFERSGKSESVYCDKVISAIGFNPGAPLADGYTGSANVHVIADASGIGNLLHTIWSAYDLCYEL